MNVSEMACPKLDVIVLPLGIWRKSYSSNLCPKYASETVFFRLKIQKFSFSRSVASLADFLSETWKYILVGHFQNMHHKLFFSGSKCNFSLPWEGDTPPRPSPRSVALLGRSSPRRSAHSDFRPPPPNISSYGPV